MSIARSWQLGILRRTSAESPLDWVAAGAGLLAGACVVGLHVDRRVLDDAPLWLKPLKFAISNGLFALTLAWMLRALPARSQFIATVARTTAVLLALENVLITGQAMRGARSHFNAGTISDTVVLAAMGAAAIALLGITCVVLVAFMRHRARTLTHSGIRWGLALSILGASIGGLMAAPRSAQLTAFAQQPGSTALGAHAVGGPDDSANDRLLYWNRYHGDLRAAHFVGLHAMQLLPLLAWILSMTRLSPARAQTALRIAGSAYGGVIVVLLAQALRGEAPLRPGLLTLSLLFAIGISAALALRVGVLPSDGVRA